MFLATTLKIKLQYDFDTLSDSQEMLQHLKTALYFAIKRSTKNSGLLANLCLCLALEAVQEQWPNMIERIVKEFSYSLEGVAAAFTVLKVLRVAQCFHVGHRTGISQQGHRDRRAPAKRSLPQARGREH